jgi:Tfp pilus assembly protein PilF
LTQPDRPDSAQSLLRAIESDPLNVSAYCALARHYESAGEPRKAELTLRRAVEMDPLRHGVWCQLGSLHMNRGQWRSAADALEQACALAPSDAGSLVGYAMALIATQDLQGASEVRDTLLRDFSARPETHLIAGHIDKISGRFADAVDSYRRALSVDPDQTAALFNLVDLQTPGLTDPLTIHLEGLLRAPSLSARDSADVHFALARIHEAAGQADRAFALYRDANSAIASAMKRTASAYEPKAAEEHAGRIIDVFRSDTMGASLERLDLGMRMIFVVGLPRSGTTLVERILSAHPRVAGAGELPFMQECLTRLLDAAASEGARILSPDNARGRRFLERLRNEYLDGLFERDVDGEHVIDKLPANFSAIGLIRMLFPDALIVHCNRDPMPNCWSLYSSHFDAHLPYHTSLDHLAHYHRNIYARLMRHWGTLRAVDIIEVRYEQLVADPEHEIPRLVARCGLPWDPACSSFHGNGQPVYTASAAQARRPMYTTSVARWRTFERHLGPLMEGLRDG